MVKLVNKPDSRFSTTVYAVVAHDFTPADDKAYGVDGHHVRNIYVSYKDAEAALSEFNLQSLDDYSFEKDFYQSSEIVPFGLSDADFCALANKKFGHIFTIKPETLLSDLDVLLPKLNDTQKLDLMDMLHFSFARVSQIQMVAE